MVEVLMRICYRCYKDGFFRRATATYFTESGEEYDVCQKHLKTVREAELQYEKISKEESIREV